MPHIPSSMLRSSQNPFSLGSIPCFLPSRIRCTSDRALTCPLPRPEHERPFPRSRNEHTPSLSRPWDEYMATIARHDTRDHTSIPTLPPFPWSSLGYSPSTSASTPLLDKSHRDRARAPFSPPALPIPLHATSYTRTRDKSTSAHVAAVRNHSSRATCSAQNIVCSVPPRPLFPRERSSSER